MIGCTTLGAPQDTNTVGWLAVSSSVRGDGLLAGADPYIAQLWSRHQEQADREPEGPENRGWTANPWRLSRGAADSWAMAPWPVVRR